MKHVLTIQDFSCVGRCSLTVALPVLSAMGIRASALPTAVLSTHTAFPAPVVADLTEQMPDFARHWKENGITFDAISVGYLADPRQVEQVETILRDFPAFTVLDPVMGDNGKLYRRITPGHVDAMRRLCAKADVVLPNLTEAAALTGLSYREKVEESDLRELTAGLLDLGAKHAVITGLRRGSAIGCCCSDGTVIQGPVIPRHFHGTGDLFAAVFLGSLMKGLSLPEAAGKAEAFVRRCIEATPEFTVHGVEFEKELPWLMGS
jgi:pyridoxine kinase